MSDEIREGEDAARADHREFVITFQFYMPADGSNSSPGVHLRNLRPLSHRRPTQLLNMIQQNAHLIAAAALESWFNAASQREQTKFTVSESAFKELQVLPHMLSAKRLLKHKLCAICQEEFCATDNLPNILASPPTTLLVEPATIGRISSSLPISGEEDSLDGVNREDLIRLPCHHLYHTSCIKLWMNDHSATCPYCRYEIETDNVEFNVGLKQRMVERDRILALEVDTDDESDKKKRSRDDDDGRVRDGPSSNLRKRGRVTTDLPPAKKSRSE